jgi:hypothetical protein
MPLKARLFRSRHIQSPTHLIEIKADCLQCMIQMSLQEEEGKNEMGISQPATGSMRSQR